MIPTLEESKRAGDPLINTIFVDVMTALAEKMNAQPFAKKWVVDLPPMLSWVVPDGTVVDPSDVAYSSERGYISVSQKEHFHEKIYLAFRDRPDLQASIGCAHDAFGSNTISRIVDKLSGLMDPKIIQGKVSLGEAVKAHFYRGERNEDAYLIVQEV